MAASDYDLELEGLTAGSVGRLLNAELFDLEAFQRLLSYLRVKAEAIADEHVVSKQVLLSLRQAEEAILNGAERVELARHHASMAGEFSFLRDLIIYGARPSERVPGVPRII